MKSVERSNTARQLWFILLKFCLIDVLHYYIVLDKQVIDFCCKLYEPDDPKSYHLFLLYFSEMLYNIYREPMEMQHWHIDPPIQGEETPLVNLCTVRLIMSEFEKVKTKLYVIKRTLHADYGVKIFISRNPSHLIDNLETYTDNVHNTIQLYRWNERWRREMWLNMLMKYVLQKFPLTFTFHTLATLRCREIYYSPNFFMTKYVAFLMYFAAIIKQIVIDKGEHLYWGISYMPNKFTQAHMLISETTVMLMYLSFVKNLHALICTDTEVIFRDNHVYWSNLNPTSQGYKMTHKARMAYIAKRQKTLNADVNR